MAYVRNSTWIELSSSSGGAELELSLSMVHIVLRITLVKLLYPALKAVRHLQGYMAYDFYYRFGTNLWSCAYWVNLLAGPLVVGTQVYFA